MEKKPYTKPTILRVKLNHKQAVLSTCSTQASSLSLLVSIDCMRPNIVYRVGCRKTGSSQFSDSLASS